MDLLEVAKRLAGLAETEAKRVGIPITFCLIDRHGNVVLKQRMTGSILASVEMSERKAYTSAAIPMRTAEMTPLAHPGRDLFTLDSVAAGRYTMIGGGVPLHLDGEHVAGIGVSGGTAEQDVEIIESVIRRFASNAP
jgi:uncharacterized protein GlcG (DUF336 family)